MIYYRLDQFVQLHNPKHLFEDHLWLVPIFVVVHFLLLSQ
ncbi:CLUMA_CG012223, isoform A [Clunio marinus]|uniref:CLUMA_CG012223, isoform A n=1 Tax=Clunio marinus TaxID=568069 RepID=A0A1J1IF63_9DIPT|nr:CLUMA_CG012223, isoform A [Clunio marinus]